jgi:two-component system KDP operon response regulator KdpE
MRVRLGSAVVVEDDAVMAATLAEALSEIGFYPVSVKSVEKARETLATSLPDLLLLDLNLVDGFGADLLESLADDPAAPVVVIVSGFALAPMVAARYEVPYVVKPFALETLLAAIEQAQTENKRPKKMRA